MIEWLREKYNTWNSERMGRILARRRAVIRDEFEGNRDTFGLRYYAIMHYFLHVSKTKDNEVPKQYETAYESALHVFPSGPNRSRFIRELEDLAQNHGYLSFKDMASKMTINDQRKIIGAYGEYGNTF